MSLPIAWAWYDGIMLCLMSTRNLLVELLEHGNDPTIIRHIESYRFDGENFDMTGCFNISQDTKNWFGTWGKSV